MKPIADMLAARLLTLPPTKRITGTLMAYNHGPKPICPGRDQVVLFGIVAAPRGVIRDCFQVPLIGSEHVLVLNQGEAKEVDPGGKRVEQLLRSRIWRV